MARGKVVEHSFYCINCGKKGIPLLRKVGHQREKLHRKKLWCPYCNVEINHVECRNYAEIEQFNEDFKNGVYINEAKESLSHVWSTGEWKNDLGKTANC